MDESVLQGYSATVSGSVHVNGTVFQLAQVGPDSCIVRAPHQCAATDARISVSIDGQEDTQDVYLTNGISADSPVVQFVRR